MYMGMATVLCTNTYMYMGMATVLCTNTLYVHVHGDGYSTSYQHGYTPKELHANSKDAHAHVCLTLPAVDQLRNHSCPLHTFPVALCKTLLPVLCTVKAKKNCITHNRIHIPYTHACTYAVNSTRFDDDIHVHVSEHHMLCTCCSSAWDLLASSRHFATSNSNCFLCYTHK